MESLKIFAAAAIWILIGLLAKRFGAESQGGVEAPSPRRLWMLPPPDHATFVASEHDAQPHLQPPRVSLPPCHAGCLSGCTGTDVDQGDDGGAMASRHERDEPE